MGPGAPRGSRRGDDDADEHLLAELEHVVTGLGRMLPGICEVVLHDLRNPQHSIRAIENNLSGRQVGDPATELGLRRIADPDYAEIVQNYPNRFPDGRAVKSTSIGIKGASGRYIAALCLNLDLSLLSPVAVAFANLVAVSAPSTEPKETLTHLSEKQLRDAVEAFAAERSTTPRALARADRRLLVVTMRDAGYFGLPGAARAIADLLGISRATVYNYLKEEP